MDTPLPPQPHAYLPGSPIALLRERIAAGLAAGQFVAWCPHPGTAQYLSLPSGTLTCIECLEASPGRQLDGSQGACASCGAPDGNGWSTWLDEAAHVLVTARICPVCFRTGNLSIIAN